MRDRGIEIVVALLEKRESILVTRDTSKSFLKELLRAESLGYARKEAKAEVFTLSEKGRRFVNSGYNYLEIENPEPSLPGISPSPQPDKGFPSMHHTFLTGHPAGLLYRRQPRQPATLVGFHITIRR